MREPIIALAFTPEPWVEALHRHFTDHGGARVRQLVMDPAVALDDDYEILVSGARWPALTRGLVAELHDRHRAVLGVASRDDHGSIDVLNHVGVDRVVMSDAAPIEFLEALLLLAPGSPTVHPAAPTAEDPTDAAQRIVVRGPGGSGATEIAVALSAHLSRRFSVALVDLDEVAPSVAQRLALPIEPNLCTAIETIEFGVGEFGIEEQSTGTDAPLRVVAGLPNAAAWSQVRPPEVERVLRAIGWGRDHVIADIAAPLDDIGSPTRGRYAVGRMALGQADVLVAVGLASPVGLSRLVSWLAEARAIAATPTVHVVLNRAQKDGFRARELVAEFKRCYRPASITVVPSDAAVAHAMWDGAFVGRGGFTQATQRLAAEISPTAAETAPARSWRRLRAQAAVS